MDKVNYDHNLDKLTIEKVDGAGNGFRIDCWGNDGDHDEFHLTEITSANEFFHGKYYHLSDAVREAIKWT